jgi:hypothetical protein
MSLTPTTKPNRTVINVPETLPYNVDVSADQWNKVVAAINNLIPVTALLAIIPMNQDHVTVTHNLNLTDTSPTKIGFCPTPADNVGRCWYDMNTITANTIDVYVANPPLEGGYAIPFLLYRYP